MDLGMHSLLASLAAVLAAEATTASACLLPCTTQLCARRPNTRSLLRSALQALGRDPLAVLRSSLLSPGASPGASPRSRAARRVGRASTELQAFLEEASSHLPGVCFAATRHSDLEGLLFFESLTANHRHF